MSTEIAAPVELVASPWLSVFYELVNTAQHELMIASPFITFKPARGIVEAIENNQTIERIQVDIVTNLAVESLLRGSLDVKALLFLTQSIPNLTVTYLPSLHAKVYIADEKAAVITSGNLTYGGLKGNHEYGVLLRNKDLVSEIRADLIRYASLGNRIFSDTLESLSQAVQELEFTRQKADNSIRSKLKSAFEERAEATKLELLKARAKDKTTHGIFCDTVLYLLEKKGPLRTVELHPLVQQIHPDLCDDTIDRVIDGVHFGKKWKHYVRNAQQALKRKRLIGFDGERWFRIKE